MLEIGKFSPASNNYKSHNTRMLANILFMVKFLIKGHVQYMYKYWVSSHSYSESINVKWDNLATGSRTLGDRGFVVQGSLAYLVLFQVVLASSTIIFLPGPESLALLDKTSNAFSEVLSIANAMSITDGIFDLRQLYIEWKVSGRIGEHIDYNTFCTQMEASRKAYCARLLVDGQLTVYSYFYTYSILNFTQLAPMNVIAQTFIWHCVQEWCTASGPSPETLHTMYETLRLFTGDNVGCSLPEFAKLVCENFETWVRFIADTQGTQHALSTLNDGLDTLKSLGISQEQIDETAKAMHKYLRD